MDISEKLIENIDGLSKKLYINKPVKKYILDNIESVRGRVNDPKLIDTMLNTLSKSEIKPDDKKILMRVGQSIILDLKKYQGNPINNHEIVDITDKRIDNYAIVDITDKKIDNHIIVDIIDKKIDNHEIIDTMNRKISYDSPGDMIYVQHLITTGKFFSISKFKDRHVLYAFIIRIETDHRYVIIKFGYSENIADRFSTLASEYKSQCLFIKAKIIANKGDEQQFHNSIRKKYPDLVEPYSINGTKKIELYKLSPILMEEFDNYLNDDRELEKIRLKIRKLELKLQLARINNPSTQNN